MKLISWNINGLRSISQKGFLDYLGKAKPDIVCLQETKLQEDQVKTDLMVPPGYRAFFSFAEKKGYSGVATFVKDDCPLDETNIKKGIGVTEFDSEGRFVITEHKKFILYNVYIPSGTTGDERQAFKYRFLDKFLEHTKTLPASSGKKLIVCGDFNICHRAIDIHHPEIAEKRELSGFLPDERAWLDDFVESGFVDSFRHIQGDIPDRYSWWSYRAGARKKNLGWRIDYFFAAKPLAKFIENANIEHAVEGSDHCPIILDLKF